MVESPWRALYKAALLELDPNQLQARVKAAEDATNAHECDSRVRRSEGIAIKSVPALRELKWVSWICGASLTAQRESGFPSHRDSQPNQS